MREWNFRGRKIHLPDIEKFNKLKCEVCGKEFVPSNKSRYIVKETVKKGGLVEAFSGKPESPETYDCFDCPQCGCQVVTIRRLERAKDD